jgi:hypothetical protein
MENASTQLSALEIIMRITEHTNNCPVYSDCDNAGVIGECNECDCPKQSRFKQRSKQ